MLSKGTSSRRSSRGIGDEFDKRGVEYGLHPLFAIEVLPVPLLQIRFIDILEQVLQNGSLDFLVITTIINVILISIWYSSVEASLRGFAQLRSSGCVIVVLAKNLLLLKNVSVAGDCVCFLVLSWAEGHHFSDFKGVGLMKDLVSEQIKVTA